MDLSVGFRAQGLGFGAQDLNRDLSVGFRAQGLGFGAQDLNRDLSVGFRAQGLGFGAQDLVFVSAQGLRLLSAQGSNVTGERPQVLGRNMSSPTYIQV